MVVDGRSFIIMAKNLLLFVLVIGVGFSTAAEEKKGMR